MRHRVPVALLAIGLPLLTLISGGTADARGASYLQAAASMPAQSATVWEGRDKLAAANGEAAVFLK